MNRFLLTFVFVLYAVAAFAVDPGDKANHALVIIDMQPKFVTRGGNDKEEANIKKVDEILAMQIKMIEQAKKSGIPIIFLEYTNFGDTNKVLKDAVGDYQDAKYFLKNTDGMFSSRNKHKEKLISYLEEKDIGSLIIAGANGGACVERSISGSLDERYNVIAFSKAIADFNYKDFIYPYDDLYSFTPECKDCSFKEIDLLPEYTLTIANGNKIRNVLSEKVNDSRRAGEDPIESSSSVNKKPIDAESSVIED